MKPAAKLSRGFKAAHKAFVESGWGALSADPHYGGQGLPQSVTKLVEEMIFASNPASGLYPGLSHGAYLALKSHGAAALKDLYLPKLVDGGWSGTMYLTEPHCGTDLGLIRTRAVPHLDRSYRLSGSKIFVSAGEHDLTDLALMLGAARRCGFRLRRHPHPGWDEAATDRFCRDANCGQSLTPEAGLPSNSWSG